MAASMIAWAIPLASTIATGFWKKRARPVATSAQAIERRPTQVRRLAGVSGRRPARVRPSVTSRALPAAATKKVE
jgi:hypothetical protein